MLPKGLQNDPLWVKRAASLRGFGHLGNSRRSRLGGGYKACTTSGGQTGCDTEAGPETPFQPNLAQKVQPNSFQLWNKTREKYKGHFDIKSNQFLDTFWKWIWAKLLELLVAEELSPNLPQKFTLFCVTILTLKGPLMSILCYQKPSRKYKIDPTYPPFINF